MPVWLIVLCVTFVVVWLAFGVAAREDGLNIGLLEPIEFRLGMLLFTILTIVLGPVSYRIMQWLKSPAPPSVKSH